MTRQDDGPDLRALLQVSDLGGGRWAGTPGATALPGLLAVPGSQVLAHLTMVATRTLADRPLRSLHTVFSRRLPPAGQHVVEADVTAAGASAATVRLQVRTGEDVCVTATALGLSPQPLEPAHGETAPQAQAPEAGRALPSRVAGLEQRSADGVDVLDPAATGAPRVQVWVRATDLPRDAGPAALAYATEPLLMGPALLPHAGWSVAQAFTRFSAAVVSHSLWFHAPLDVGDWWLVDAHSVHLSAGRAYDRADVFDEEGRLVASACQEGLLRPLATPATPEVLHA